MVVGKVTKHKQKAKQSPGQKGTRGSTSKKKGQDSEESPESSDEDTKAQTQARRTRSTLKQAEFIATETFLQTRAYLDSSQVFVILIRYGSDTREEHGLLTSEVLRDDTIFTATESLKGSKIALLISDIAHFLRGERQ